MKEFPNLDNLSVASPCNADWDSMTGDERKRLCGLCKKNVYNISSLTKEEAEDLLQSNENICVQFFRRKDGTIMTEDCPVGLRKLKAGARRLTHFVAYVLAFLITTITGIKAEAKDSTITLTGGISYSVFPKLLQKAPNKGYLGRPFKGAILNKKNWKYQKSNTAHSGNNNTGVNNEKKENNTFQENKCNELYTSAKQWQRDGKISMALLYFQKSLDAFDNQYVKGDPKFREQIEKEMNSLTESSK